MRTDGAKAVPISVFRRGHLDIHALYIHGLLLCKWQYDENSRTAL